MSQADVAAASPSAPGRNERLLFWGCFIALITTAFGFITRVFLVGDWATEFGLDQAQAGRLAGIGIWPFAASIIGFSLIIDKIGYKVAMVFAFIGHIVWAIMGVAAYFASHEGGALTADPAKIKAAYNLLYWGSLVLALGNGTVEAFINPVVATMFSREKTKWLNILHAGWPGGLVLAGIIVIYMGTAPWGVKIGILAVPAIVYFIMLLPLKFPVHERVTSGVTYRQMLAEFGILGALIVAFLVTLQLMEFFDGVRAFSTEVDGQLVLAGWAKGLFIGIGVAMVVAFAAYTRSFGRPILFFLVLIMMPLATTEIGTDGWITDIMKGIASEQNFDAGWVLVYTSVIMVVLRFFAGPIVHAVSPLGLLAISAVLAIAGLWTLSFTTGMMIFAAATLYGFGKTFFWPTMLGVVAEQTPRGGALTLNAISGIGMLAVGILGFPFIGALQDNKQVATVAANQELAQQVPGLVEDGKLTVAEDRNIYVIIPYQAINEEQLKAKIGNLPEAQQEAAAAELTKVRDNSKQLALANMTMFPVIMLVGYLILIAYFKSKGGYKAQVLTGHAAQDKKFTGGIEAPVEA